MKKMKTLSLALLFCLTAAAVEAVPLKVVNVSAPKINCVFSPSCTTTVTDTSETFKMSNGGTGLLQSRTFKGSPGSMAAGLSVYEYRLDLRNAVGTKAISCIDSIELHFGPANDLDYDGDKKPDQVFVVTSGGMGTVGINSAVLTASQIKFTFTTPICEGGSAGKGQSSFFWGLVSSIPLPTPPAPIPAGIHETGGVTHFVKTRTPDFTKIAKFTVNPFFEDASVFDTELMTKAWRDFEAIINLGGGGR